MRQRMKWLPVLLTVCLMMGLVVGCAKNENAQGKVTASVLPTKVDKEVTTSASPEVDKKVNLRLYSVSALDKDEFDQIIPEWNKLHPNISVELVVLTGADS